MPVRILRGRAGPVRGLAVVRSVAVSHEVGAVGRAGWLRQAVDQLVRGVGQEVALEGREGERAVEVRPDLVLAGVSGQPEIVQPQFTRVDPGVADRAEEMDALVLGVRMVLHLLRLRAG